MAHNTAYDVFLCHNSEDKPVVKDIAQRLKEEGHVPWLDEWALQPGLPWQRELEKNIRDIAAAAVFVGKNGVGPWQQEEIDAYLRQFVKRGCPVIPVILPDCSVPPELPVFLEGHTWVDFRIGWDDALEKLIWGITGDKPNPVSAMTVGEVRSRRLVDHATPTGPKTEKSPRMSHKTKVLAAVCIVVLMTIILTGVFLRGGQHNTVKAESNSIRMGLVYIPAGSFMMGSADSAAELAREYNTDARNFEDEMPQHKVNISKGFWMGQTEVTQGQYETVMNARPWSGKENVRENPNNPAVYVSWDDAAEFCRKLSLREGKMYRLPTEAEWEYACRAGTKTRFNFGDSRRLLEDYAWYAANAYREGEQYAHPVGQKKPNSWELYDMHGNVAEWCSDYYEGEYYSHSPDVDPAGPSSGTSRSVRGGSWGPYESALRCSPRYGASPADSGADIGFRVVRSQ